MGNNFRTQAIYLMAGVLAAQVSKAEVELMQDDLADGGSLTYCIKGIEADHCVDVQFEESNGGSTNVLVTVVDILHSLPVSGTEQALYSISQTGQISSLVNPSRI